MAFSTRPERSKVNRSPVAAKKSPGGAPGTGMRKCSSPVFTSSPSRPSVKAPLRSLLKSPEHHHVKENGHLGSSQRPLGKSLSQPTRPPATASPKKVFGEHNDSVMRPRRLRKEWQIPSPSALELKESLSGMSDAGVAVDKSCSFTINSQMLSEPEPVAGWIQTREETVISKPKKDPFEEKVPARHSPSRSEHSYAGSSTVETTHEEELTSELREGSLVSECVSVRLEEKSQSLVVTEVVPEETPVASEVEAEKNESSLAPESSEDEKASVITEVVQVEQVTFHEEIVEAEIAESRRSFFKPKKWSLVLGLLFLLSCALLTVTVPGEATLSAAANFMHRLSSNIDWSSDSDTVAFYVDPGRLRTDVLRAKVYFDGVHGKWHGSVMEKASKCRRHVEHMGVRTIEFVGSYYSSLVLQNHAKDLLFNYCDKFQGQYHQLRLALVSLTQQIRPVEATARAMFMRLKLDESVAKAGEWIRSAERFAYKALVLDYLHLPAEDNGAANFEQEDTSVGATDYLSTEAGCAEDSEHLVVGSTDSAVQEDEAAVSVQYPVSDVPVLANHETGPAVHEDAVFPVYDPVSDKQFLAEPGSSFEEEAPAGIEILPTDNNAGSMIYEEEETDSSSQEEASSADNEILPTENDAGSMIHEGEAADSETAPAAETVEAIEGLTQVPELPLLEEDATAAAAMELVSHAKLYATAAASALLLMVAYVSYQIFSSDSKSVTPSFSTKHATKELPVTPSFNTKHASREPRTPCSGELQRIRGVGEELLSPEQPAGEFSPYGSFTAYKRVVVNEGSEKEHITLTPVRRSSRIRNQAFQSPRLN